MPVVYKSRFDTIVRRLPDTVDDGVEQGAQVIAKSAQARVNVLYRRLQPDIHVEKVGRGEYAVVAGGADQPHDAFWGHFLEFGTVHSRPFPFLIPAVEASEDVVEHLVAGALRDL